MPKSSQGTQNLPLGPSNTSGVYIAADRPTNATLSFIPHFLGCTPQRLSMDELVLGPGAPSCPLIQLCRRAEGLDFIPLTLWGGRLPFLTSGEGTKRDG